MTLAARITTPLHTVWARLLPREQMLVQAAIALVSAALLWWLALAPALQTLRTADARHQTLDAQLQQMKRLQTQAQQLQNQPTIGFDEAQRALEAAVKQRLGATGSMSVQGDHATVTLQGTPAEAIAPWLAQVRTNARALPTQAQLTRSSAAQTVQSVQPDAGSTVTPTRWHNVTPNPQSPPISPSTSTPTSITTSITSGPARWDGVVVLALPAR